MWPRSCSSAAAARSSASSSVTGRLIVAGTARLRERVMVGYKRPMDAPPDLAAELGDALAREFLGAGDPLVDRLQGVRPGLWRFRFRWREEDGAHAAWLAARDPVGGRLSAVADRARALGRDDLVDAAAALRPGRPRAGTMALCHGDFRPEQLLLGGAGPTLVGWARAGIGDPRLDLAHASV